MDRKLPFDFVVLTPPGVPQAALAIAGSRAGALGVLNLEFAQDESTALAALQQLQAQGHGRSGVLIDGEAETLLAAILAASTPALDTVILTASAPEQLARIVPTIKQSGRRAYLVVTNQQEAEAGVAAGVDALIAKGHEAGGWVGEETSFVLLQRLAARCDLPIWVQGGIGRHSVVAAYVAGAAGCVLDNQLLLARESPLPEAVKARLNTMDGSETYCWGASLGAAFRTYTQPGLPIIDDVRRLESDLVVAAGARGDQQRVWRTGLGQHVGWHDARTALLAVGQDAAFAAGLARHFGTVGGILTGLRQAIHEHLAVVQHSGPLGEGAPLARSHGTQYPIVQGPMTRVSDQAEFAAAVAAGGGLPFLALALMRAGEVKQLLAETWQILGDRPWGVGILGFVPPELRAEQLEVIRAARPPFALIAGGRPDQALTLEQEHISTYLHVPSPGLLKLFLQEGARRFVFEGRECGGHVGPRTSFVLWESMIDVLQDNLPAGTDPGDYHVLFAGGIHDGLSAAMVAAMAAPLVKRGVRIGVLLGTAYLFTDEAVAAGAIVPGFQHAALACERTVLVESGPGHATRCAPSPFVDTFEQEKRELLHKGATAEAMRNHLETLNVGRLRVASKGLDRHPKYGQDGTAPRLIALTPEDQLTRGMFMIGQVAALRDSTCTIADLHGDVADGSTRLLAQSVLPSVAPETPLPSAAIAIVGMACILPGAADVHTYWANILNKVDAVTEVPPERWDWRRYYDPDRGAADKINSRWGGFIPDVPFDPVVFGMPPNSVASIEPFQLLTLAVVRAALQDAGYLDRPFPRERTSVVLGAGGGAGDLTVGYMTRSSLPTLFGDSATDLTERLGDALPEWTEDSFPGLLMNVAAGRVANRFDLGGVNYTVDAACASSLAAVYLAVRDLEARTSDVAIVGGLDAIQNPFSFTAFSKTHALSPSGRCRPFDAEADGIAISDGFAMLVLKRLADAERDGDQIYAVIRGVGGSSDGRDRSLTAPRPAGQIRALERAYAQAGFSPATVELIEAHGTGTVVGDQSEVESLTTFFTKAGAKRQGCAIGSVKSMIGHTKTTAGVAGLIKTALALHHQVLPPTLGVTQPNPKANFPETPLYVNTEPRPWVQRADGAPRRAGVSAFGFGGTNFHVVVEEYTGAYLPRQSAVVDPWPAELLVWRGTSRQEIVQAITALSDALERGAQPRLADMAYTLMLQARAAAPLGPTLAIVATSLSDVRTKVQQARDYLRTGERQHTPQGIHYAEAPLAKDGQIAFLFPGQGSQYVNMLRQIAIAFPEARASLDRADATLATQLEQPLTRYVFPPPVFTTAEEQQQQAALTATEIAQPALGATDVALLRLIRALGVDPQMVAGHSYGEFVALFAAGCFDEDTLLRLSAARGRFIREGAAVESGAMAAVDADAARLHGLLAGLDLTLANINAPQQTVISGTRAAIDEAITRCTAQEVRARLLPVACAFHSPLMAPAQERLAAFLDEVQMARPAIPVYSNTTGAVYPDDPAEIAGLLSNHLVRPVEFVREITTMYEAGARLFVEVGPRSVLTGLVSRILGEHTHVAVSLDQASRPGIEALLQGLAALVAEGVAVKLEHLFVGRAVRRLDLAALDHETGIAHHSPTTWLVGGGRARPLRQAPPAPRLPLRVAMLDGDVAAQQTTGTAPAPTRPVPTPPVLTPPQRVPVPRIAAASAAAERSPATVQVYSPTIVDDSVPQDAGMTVAVAQPFTPPAPAGAGEVMQHFQKVMQRFLETQNNVMLAYLQARPVAGTGRVLPEMTQTALVHPSPARIVATVPAASDLGRAIPPTTPLAVPPPTGSNGSNGHGPRHDAPAASVPVPSVAAPVVTAAQAAPLTREQIQDRLLGVVGERTGYPLEMLGLEADLEADLGIDSIKRVEIVATVVRALTWPTGKAPDMDVLTGSRTLRHLIDRLAALAIPAGAPADSPAPQAVPPTGSNGSNGHGPRHDAPAASVPVPSVAAPVVTATQAAPLTREQIQDRLLGVVGERTGYPLEMLGLEADLEADLGIDSIKRVEIVATVVRALTWPTGKAPDMDVLTGSRTLRHLIDRLAALAIPADSPAPREAASAGDRRPFDGEPAMPSPIGRFIARPVPAPALTEQAGLARGVVLIVDDQTGVGEQVGGLLSERGHHVVRVICREDERATGAESVIVTDLSRPEEVTRLVETLHARHGHVAALIHLAALRPGADTLGLDPGRWASRLGGDLFGLFLLVQALAADLQRAAADGGGAVLAATALGGAFAVDRQDGRFFAGQASVTGFLKTFAQECGSVRVKAIDLPSEAPRQVADWLMAELMAPDGLIEIGYKDGRRTLLEMIPEALSPRNAALPLDSSSVVLVTGGARGITAEVAVRLAERYRPTIVLVGRTPLPTAPEDGATAGLTEPQDLKRAIIEQRRVAGLPLLPAKVEETYRHLLREREVRHNLLRFQQIGVRVDYHVCDVRDVAAFGGLIDALYHTYRRLDGVIHGAGILEDKLIRDKTIDSFRRVLETKVNSSLVLAAKLRPESLRFLVFFSSIAGRLGNRGQADYTATNEVISKLSISLDRQWPGRVVAVEWGPWAMLGMATPEIQRQFTERGVALVPVDLGCRFLLAELEDGPREDSVVVVAGGPAVTDAARYGQAVTAAQAQRLSVLR